MQKKRSKYALIAFVVAAVLFIPTALMQSSYAAKKVTPGMTTLTDVSSPAYNKVKISWKKTSGTTHYKIYYRKAGTKKWNGVKTVSNKYSSYIHTSNKSDPIVVGQKYEYTVKGYNSKYKTYGKYNTKGLTVSTKPETVKLTKVSLNENFESSVDVEWKKAKGCNYYKIYRKSGSKWKYLDTVPADQPYFLDTNPDCSKKNTYTVKAYYSKTKTYGNYNKKGLSIFVPGSNRPTKPTPTPEEKPTLTLDEMAAEVVRLTNIERAKQGTAPLISHPLLQKAAMIRAKEISEKFSHTRPNGTDSTTAAEELGLPYTTGENICRWASTPKDVVEVWMDSPGHQHPMMASFNHYIGVGVYNDKNGNTYWVQQFTDNDIHETVTLTFNPNGGTCDISSMQIPYKKRILQSDLPVPSKPGYIFKGWADVDFGYPILGYYTIREDTHFEAVWEKA